MPYSIGKFPGQGGGQFNMTEEFYSGVQSIQLLSGSRGPWVQMVAAAPKGCTGFILTAEDSLALAGAGSVDVGIGAVGSEQVIARNIYKEWTPANQGLAHFGGFFPISINEGLPVSMRGQGTGTHVAALCITLVRGNHGQQFQYCEGMSGVVRAAIMSTGNWTVIGSTGTRPWKGFMPFIGEDGGAQGDANISFGFGYGSGAGSFYRRVGRYQANHDMGPCAAPNNLCFPMHIEANRALYTYSSVANIVTMSHILFR